MKTAHILVAIAMAVSLLTGCRGMHGHTVSGLSGDGTSMDQQNREAGHAIMKKSEGKKGKTAEILVNFKSGVGKEKVDRIAAEYGLTIIKIISPPGLYLVRIREGSSVNEVIQRLNTVIEVEYAEPNYTRK